jgi:prevent-host-death family protein
MAKEIRRSGVRRVPLSEIKDDLSRFLHEAEGEEIVITRNGKPAGVLIGFGSEDEWLKISARKRPAVSRAKELARGARRQDRGCGVRTPERNHRVNYHRNLQRGNRREEDYRLYRRLIAAGARCADAKI